jgi:hypothetical protein
MSKGKKKKERDSRLGTYIKLVVAIAVIGATLVGTYVVFNRISERALNLVLGATGVLVVVVVVGVLFIAKDLLQTYLIQRTVAQDDYNDLKQMAMIQRLMGKEKINVQLPEQPQWDVGKPQELPEQVFSGEFRDTTVELE